MTEWSDPPDAIYESHAHPYPEVRVVLAGEITFVVGTETIRLGPGDRIDFAPGQAHAARVGAEGATYLAATAR